MAQVIENLLVGIGLETDKKSFQTADNAMDDLKSRALQLGAIVGGAFGVHALTFGFAEEADALGKFAKRWGLAANDVSAYDRALQHAGGNTGDFLGTVTKLSKALSMAPYEKAAMLSEPSKFGIADQVSSVLDSGNALDAFLASADQLSTLQGRRREKFIEAMGFSQAEVELLSSGRDEITRVVAEQKKMAPLTEQMTETAARFNGEWQDLMTNMSGFSSLIAEPVTSGIANVISGMNDWIEVNREFANSVIDTSVDLITENIGLVTAALATFGGAKVLGGVSAVGKAIGLISKDSVTASKGIGLMTKGLIAYAGYEIVTAAGKGGPLSATSLFGENDLTEFLDAPISEHFDSIGSSITANAPTTQAASYGTQPTTQAASYAYGTQPTVKVDVSLDGNPVRAIIKQFILEEGEQVIQDFASSDGG